MSRPLAVILVAVAAIGLGAAAAFLGRGGETSAEDLDEIPRRTQSQREEAFHVGMKSSAKVSNAVSSLGRLTGDKARTLGDHKDDIALLADDPEVIQAILEAYELRAGISRYEAAAFVDIFERVAHPHFVAPLRRLMSHEDETVRSKTIPAARTQAHPSLTPHLDRLWRDLVEKYKGEGAYTRGRILTAAAACGGEHLPVLLDRGFADDDPEVRIRACVITADGGGLGMEARLREATRDPNAAVRYHAGRSLLALGRPGGEDLVREAIESPDDRVAIMAMEAASQLEWYDAVPAIKARLRGEGVSRELAYSANLALCRLDDHDTIARLVGIGRREAVSDDELLLAAAGMAATGDPVHLPLLRELAGRGRTALVGAIDAGLSVARPGPVDLDLARVMIDCPRVHIAHIHSLLVRGGDALVSLLTARLREAETSQRKLLLAAALGVIGTPAAREALVACRPLHRRFMDEQIRALDLALRRGRRER